MANVVTFGALGVLVLITGAGALSFGSVGAVLAYAAGIAAICAGVKFLEDRGMGYMAPRFAPSRKNRR
jgi:hypothetical protein